MARPRELQNWIPIALLAALIGCAGTTSRTTAARSAPSPIASDRDRSEIAASPSEPASPSTLPASPPVRTVSYQTAEAPRAATEVADDPCDPFRGQAELSPELFVAEVERRNPSLQAATAAWRAAAERYPQAISLDDPMFGFMLGPRGLGRMDNGGWMVEATQKMQWPGKRALRGTAALAEADAMRGDIGDTRLQLKVAAKTALLDYYLARRQAEVNARTVGLIGQFRGIAKKKYEVNQATEQDVLQADVELATLESRRTELLRDEYVAIARINTLLHRDANHRLPAPPSRVPLPDSLPAIESLHDTAERARPDLFAEAARIRAEQANLELACKDYMPDPELAVKYDGFMPEEMRPQIGMNFNVPIRNDRRAAAVREASSRLQQRRAEYQNRLDQVRFDVQAAYQRAHQGQQVVQLYGKKILPTIERNIESAQANYSAGRIDFLRLLDAERQFNAQQEMYYQALADYHRRVAELERAVGESLE